MRMAIALLLVLSLAPLVRRLNQSGGRIAVSEAGLYHFLVKDAAQLFAPRVSSVDGSAQRRATGFGGRLV